MVYDIIKEYICAGCPNEDTCHKDNWSDTNEMAYCLEGRMQLTVEPELADARAEVRWSEIPRDPVVMLRNSRL